MSLFAAVGLIAGLMVTFAASPALAGGSGSVTVPVTVGSGSISAAPNQNLSTPQTIAVTGSGLPAGSTMALTMCANAHSDGTTPVTPAELATQNYCFANPAGVGTNIFLVSTDGSGNLSGTYPLFASGIGAGNGTCVARQPGMLPCTIAVADAATQGATVQGTLPLYMAGSAPAPTLATSAVSGQSNPAAGRVGNVITLGGANWQNASTGFTVVLCATAGGTGCDAPFTTESATVSSNALGGSATIPAGSTPGSRFLIVSNTNGDVASQAFKVLGTPTVSLSPSAGGPGTPVTVSGTNWDTGASLAAFQSDGVGQLGVPSGGTADGNGNISAGLVVTVNDPGTVAIGVIETGNPAINGGAPFLLSNLSCVPSGLGIVSGGPTTGGPDADASTSNGCSLLQNINLTVNGSTISFSEAGSSVDMTPVTLNGADQPSTGSIQQLTVVDARGSLSGWVVNATMTNLTDGTALATPANHHAIPAGNMHTTTITCAPTSTATGVASDVAVGLGGALDPTAAITLCTAAPGGGGGTFNIGADLALNVPASIAAGHYVAQMTLLIT